MSFYMYLSMQRGSGLQVPYLAGGTSQKNYIHVFTVKAVLQVLQVSCNSEHKCLGTLL